MRRGAAALSPENPVIIGAGPLIGTLAPGASRVVCTTKFPLTSAVGTASGSMNFASQLKYAGYDHLVITGAASKPVYLRIADDDVEICDASALWGMDACEAADALWEEHGNDCGIISIGQAGENLVRFSLALVDKTATLGRGGLGAVFGAKKLKAIVVSGSGGVSVADAKGFLEIVEGLYERLRRYPLRDACVDLGIMSNWENYVKQFFTPDVQEKVAKLYGVETYKKVKKMRVACPSCFIADKDVLEIRDGAFAGLITYASSFFNATLFSKFTDDYREALKLTDMLNRYGLCLLTFSSLADFLIRIYENGIVRKEDMDGMELRRDFSTLAGLIEKITFRRGVGNVLADGWTAVFQKFDAERQAAVVKGKDCLWDPRLSGLGTMEFEQIVCPRGPTSATGGSPTYVPGTPPEAFRRHCERMGAPGDAIERILAAGLNIGRLTRYAEDWYAVLSSLGICNRHMNNRFYSAKICAELYSKATGVKISAAELMRAAERAWNVFKAVNVREGFTRAHDKIPEHWFEPLRFEGGVATLMDYYRTKELSKDDLGKMLDDYYDERGWDVKKGIPTKQKLLELGLDDIAEDLERMGE